MKNVSFPYFYKKIYLVPILFSTLLAFSCNIQAAGYTEMEILLLPPFCKARFSNNQKQKNIWSKKLGRKNFTWMNHYCSALVAQSRCEKISNSKKRTQCFTKILGAFEYTFENTSANFPLRPLIFMDRANIFIKLNKYSNAETDLKKSIQINPKFVRPYLTLSRLYENQKDNSAAIDIIQKGLKHKPNSTVLKKYLVKLQKIK